MYIGIRRTTCIVDRALVLCEGSGGERGLLIIGLELCASIDMVSCAKDNDGNVR